MLAFALLLVTLLVGSGCSDRVLDVGGARVATASSTPATLAQAQTSTTEHGRLRRPFRILFIGNSLTEWNNLPAMVAGISRAAGDDPPLEAVMVAFGGYALEDHLAQGDAVHAIEQGGWDVVALQQGPSTLPESRENLVYYAGKFAEKIRAAGARPALYGVWPEEERLYAFDAGIASYRAAAEAVDGLYFPAALAWKTAWQADPSLPFYGPDRFHPSPLGTYAAALVIYAEVRDKSPVGLPSKFRVGGSVISFPPAQALAAQQAAEVVTLTRRRPGKPWAARRLPHADEFPAADLDGSEGDDSTD